MPVWLESVIANDSSEWPSQVLLACTRGLFPAPLMPSRDSDVFEVFRWSKEAYSIPSGSTVFTDGSLLDNKLCRSAQALGWAFVVLDPEGHLVCSAYGTPPEWIDTIQGAELWAVQMALAHVTFPERVYTDCDSVRTGSAREFSWASSAKRRYARVWSAIALQIEGRSDVIQWMPAHTSEESIGHKCTSEGTPITADMWWSNQMVDYLAKLGAGIMRHSGSDTRRFLKWEEQVCQLMVFLAHITVAANEHVLPSGETVRDSEALSRAMRTSLLRASPAKGGKKINKPIKCNMHKTAGSFQSSSCKASYVSRGGRSKGVCFQHGKRRFGAAQAAKSHKARQLALEATFLESWREERAKTLRPSNGPSASVRMEALKARLAARGSAS